MNPHLDGIVFERTRANKVRSVSVPAAVHFSEGGYRQVLLSVQEGHKKDNSGWSEFLKQLKQRCLAGVESFISDACLGLVESVVVFYPAAKWQSCIILFYRNMLSVVPRGKMNAVLRVLKAIHAFEKKQAAIEKAETAVRKLEDKKLRAAAWMVRQSILETPTYYDYSSRH